MSRRMTAGAAALALASAPLISNVASHATAGLGPTASSPNAAGAARFLTQATYGPTDGDIANVESEGVSAWVDQQEAMPVSASHRTFVEQRLAAEQATNPAAKLQYTDVFDSVWSQAATAPDQLRQRVKLALSEIFVISFTGQTPLDMRGAASYYDMLGANAFGNFRTLLQQVALHPMMGVYLTYLGNIKENTATGQTPDENFARELQQLMSIGLYQLNQDGTLQLDSSHNPIPTYGETDVKGLAKVFTGFGWYSPNPISSGGKSTFYGPSRDPSAAVTPMIAYPTFHSISSKAFLGTSIPATTTPDPNGDLTIALDTIFNHPNVGPFIGKQLIQRLVTSNPSPAYVSRVAAVFNNDGTGVRGNLGAVVKAVLTDPEARDDTVVASPTFGKLREPMVRVGNWLRAFNATSTSGWWLIGSTSGPTSFDQSPLFAPDVFNFWRPGYSPPNTTLGAQGLAAPEFQAANVVSVAGYLNTVQSMIAGGIGLKSPTTGLADVQSAYANEMAVANDPGALADRLNLLLLYGSMSATLRDRIISAVSIIKPPTPPATTAQINTALNQRVRRAVAMVFGAPEYLAQR